MENTGSPRDIFWFCVEPWLHCTHTVCVTQPLTSGSHQFRRVRGDNGSLHRENLISSAVLSVAADACVCMHVCRCVSFPLLVQLCQIPDTHSSWHADPSPLTFTQPPHCWTHSANLQYWPQINKHLRYFYTTLSFSFPRITPKNLSIIKTKVIPTLKTVKLKSSCSSVSSCVSIHPADHGEAYEAYELLQVIISNMVLYSYDLFIMPCVHRQNIHYEDPCCGKGGLHYFYGLKWGFLVSVGLIIMYMLNYVTMSGQLLQKGNDRHRTVLCAIWKHFTDTEVMLDSTERQKWHLHKTRQGSTFWDSEDHETASCEFLI